MTATSSPGSTSSVAPWSETTLPVGPWWTTKTRRAEIARESPTEPPEGGSAEGGAGLGGRRERRERGGGQGKSGGERPRECGQEVRQRAAAVGAERDESREGACERRASREAGDEAGDDGHGRR